MQSSIEGRIVAAGFGLNWGVANSGERLPLAITDAVGVPTSYRGDLGGVGQEIAVIYSKAGSMDRAVLLAAAPRLLALLRAWSIRAILKRDDQRQLVRDTEELLALLDDGHARAWVTNFPEPPYLSP